MGEITGYIKWVIVALLIIAALVYALRRVLAHYGRSLRDMFRPAPPQPPHVVAFAALEKLRGERLWQQEKYKQYYSALTDILRSYLVGQFGIGAMEMTSDEIIEAVRGIDVPRKNAMDLTEILREADLVKFAKATPAAEQNEAAYRAVWDFVEQTKPAEPEPEQPEAAAGGKSDVKTGNKSDVKTGDKTEGKPEGNGGAAETPAADAGGEPAADTSDRNAKQAEK